MSLPEEEGTKRHYVTAAAEFWLSIKAERERKRKRKRKAAVEGKKSQVKGKRSCVENPISASATTVMEDEEYHFPFELLSSASPFTGTEAPGSPYYVDLAEYPPGTDIAYERIMEDDGSIVAKVPRGAREDYRRKCKLAWDPEEYHLDGTITLKTPLQVKP